MFHVFINIFSSSISVANPLSYSTSITADVKELKMILFFFYFIFYFFFLLQEIKSNKSKPWSKPFILFFSEQRHAWLGLHSLLLLLDFAFSSGH